jgi:peptidoglycan/xylan/chitin deacetylase (PgdA/CDA1 family)
LVSVLSASKVLDAAMVAKKYVRRSHLPIVCYHRLGVGPRDARELDEGVVDASPETFARHVELLSRRFTVVGLDDLRRHFAGEAPLPRNAALITFDDGYRPCIDVALPVLKRFGVKAVFFLPTQAIGERRTFFWDRVSWLVKRSSVARIELEYPSPAVYDLTGDRADVIGRIMNVIKTTFALDLERYLRELGAALRVEWTPEIDRRIADDVLITWDEARTLLREGMEIGSHTHTHRVLGTLPPDDLKRELEGSRRMLEEQLDAPVRAIAYPIAWGTTNRSPIFEAVRRAGYDLGFAGSGGKSPFARENDRLDIARFGVDPGLPDAMFDAQLAIPGVLRRLRR